MAIPKILILIVTVLLLGSISSTTAQSGKKKSPSPTPTPAPAPAPDYVNLTDLLTVTGPFHTFLNYLESTKVIETFQNQANSTDQGITIFVPKDDAFTSLKKPSLSNLTQDQLKSLLLFHALPHYYALADFKKLGQSGPAATFAGGSYTLNFTDLSGTVRLSTGWTSTNISSSVRSTDPVALYQVDKVLLPQAIFGVPPPPSASPPVPVPAPAPASSNSSSPSDAPVADGPSGSDGNVGSSSSSPQSSKDSTPSSSPPCKTLLTNLGVLSYSIVGIFSGLLVILL